VRDGIIIRRDDLRVDHDAELGVSGIFRNPKRVCHVEVIFFSDFVENCGVINIDAPQRLIKFGGFVISRDLRRSLDCWSLDTDTSVEMFGAVISECRG